MKQSILVAAFLLSTGSAWAQASLEENPLPPALQRAAEQASESGLPYPGFEEDLATARSHFENGKVELGHFVSNRMLKQLKNLATGLPEDIVVLVKRARTETKDYPGRDTDLKQLSHLLERGQFKKSKTLAERILKKAKNLALPTPKELLSLGRQIEAEKAEYQGRDADLRRIAEFIREGDFEAARRRSRSVLKRQKNARIPPPDALLALVNSIEAEQVDYPGRDAEVSRFLRTIEVHNYERAMTRGQAILRQQENLRNGMPQTLSELVQAVHDERVDYRAREEELSRLNQALRQGKFRVAEARALQIIRQQRHLKR